MDAGKSRPIVRAFVARKRPDGMYGRARIVSLGEALLLQQTGRYAVVGPDTQDVADVARWDRENEPTEPEPFNPLRVP